MPGIGLFPLRIKTAVPAGPLPPTPAETLLADGNTVAWYDFNQLGTITKDGSNFVSRWNDRLGSGRDLIQATGTCQPLWQADGILFDGIDNSMKTGALVLNQPAKIYWVYTTLVWKNGTPLLNGNGPGTATLIQTLAKPLVRMGSSTFMPEYDGPQENVFAINRVLFNGATSKYQINEGVLYTGNAGTVGFTVISLANYGSSSMACSNIKVKEAIFRKVADTPEDEATIYNYLKTKYGL